MKSNVTFNNYFKHKLNEMSIAAIVGYIEMQVITPDIQVNEEFDSGVRFAKKRLITPLNILKQKLTEGK